MTEHFLHDTEVGTPFEQVRGEGMAESMRGDRLTDPGLADSFLDNLPEAGAAERPIQPTIEQWLRRII